MRLPRLARALVRLLSDSDEPRLLGRRSWADALGELRVAVRGFRRRPLYSVGVAGTLGLGLAAAVI